MKLKQVTFTEALEVMKAGGFAHHGAGTRYRVVGKRLECASTKDENWTKTENDLGDVLKDWFIEVEPRRAQYPTKLRAGCLSPQYLGSEWNDERVRVTVEEL